MKKLIVLCILNALFFSGCAQEDSSSKKITDTSALEEVVSYGTDYESTWGDLIEANGGELVWDTLTPEQQVLVNYPEFDESNVYWVPEGKSFHAVDWCYTLSRSKTILSGTYDEAISNDLEPCSKCVGE